MKKKANNETLSRKAMPDFITSPSFNHYNLMLLHANKKAIQHSQ
jgi:hypothetical protein